MIPNNRLNKLYLDILGLPRLSVKPELTSIFFDQDDQLLKIPGKIKYFKYLDFEDPISLSSRMANFLFPNSIIIKLVPIAVSPDDQIIVFIKILTSTVNIQPEIKNTDDLSNTEIYDICKKRFITVRENIFNEIEASEKLGWRLVIHRKLIKPLYYSKSNLIIKNEILRFSDSLSLNNESLVCDLACGYDNLAIKIAQKYKSVALLSDVVSKPIIGMANEGLYNRTLYLNEDCLKIELNIKADLLLCKNVLHHLNTIGEIEMMFDKMSSLSDVLVIIDPEDPKTTFLGRFWNFYYRKFLLDQGEKFISFISFNSLIYRFFPNDKIIIKKIKTIKGPFMVAFVDKRK